MWQLGENDGRIKYPTSECGAQIGDVAIFYQTKQKEKTEGRVQYVGESYEIADKYNGEKYDDM